MGKLYDLLCFIDECDEDGKGLKIYYEVDGNIDVRFYQIVKHHDLASMKCTLNKFYNNDLYSGFKKADNERGYTYDTKIVEWGVINK